MSRDEAIALYNTEWWRVLPEEAVARFQLAEPLLVMPFAEFHRCVEAALGRPVWTHEFADMESLRGELDGSVPTPTLQEIIGKLPADKQILIVDLDSGDVKEVAP